ncbi:MAG: hypothetical protein IBX62_01330 [Coriobacteriia bacterium]|nr:hypothetical protein [Coriobacteriia bacterium]
MAGRPVRTLITVVMDILVVVAVALTIHLVVGFFGTIAQQEWARALLGLTRWLVLPLGLEPVETPYGGVFDVDATVSIVAVLIGEWVLSIVRRQA